MARPTPGPVLQRLALAAALLGACDRADPAASAAADGSAAASAAGRPWFVEVTADRGLTFVHRAGLDRSYSVPEIMSPGAALFDADGDGDLDAYLVQVGARAGVAPAGPPSTDRFFRQGEDGTFRDDTAAAGLGDPGFGMGCAVGDVDNDGDLDLYVTRYGPDRLYRNDGGGRFRDDTAAAGLGDPGWSSSAGFFDADGDGFLDLYVVRYLDYDPSRICRSMSGRREFCGPTSFPGLSDRFYRNRGDGTFEDAGAAAGIDRVAGKGLGLAIADFDGDGLSDVYAANDGEANQLWINLGGGRFEDRAVLMGAAVNLLGRPEASMGVAAGDIDGDGDLDLLMTHLDQETNTLYRNLDGTAFEDRTHASGLGNPSLPFTGFGTALFDLELDGDLDLLVVNGKVRRGGAEATAGAGGAGAADAREVFDLAEYAEPNQLFVGDGSGAFRDVSGRAGELTARREVTRAVLAGDVDGDGDLDLLLTNSGGPARLYRNDAPRRGAWLAVRAVDPALGRDAVGALVRVEAGGRVRVRPVTHTYGYLSSAEAVAHFGLGDAGSVDRITVRWPGGGVEEFPGGPAGRTVVVERGGGRTLP